MLKVTVVVTEFVFGSRGVSRASSVVRSYLPPGKPKLNLCTSEAHSWLPLVNPGSDNNQMEPFICSCRCLAVATAPNHKSKVPKTLVPLLELVWANPAEI